MALQLADRVQQTGTANTTVSFSLTGAVVGFQSFSSAITTGNTTYYAASDGTNWEVGVGTLTSSSLLTRTTIISSSNSGSAVSTFGSSINIFVTQPAENTVVSSNNPGTTGTVLTSNGTGVAPSWAAVVNSFSAGSTGLTPSTASTGAVTLAGTLNVANGGTGLTSVTSTYIPYGNGTSALSTSSSLTYASSTLTAPIVSASNGLVVNSNTVSASYSIPSGSSAMSVGPMTIASGQTVTVPSGGRWVVL